MVSVDNAGTPGAPHVVLTQQFDASGNRVLVEDNLGTAVASSFDARQQLATRTWTVAGGDAARLEVTRNPLGQPAALDRFAPSGGGWQPAGESAFAYDAKGRLTDLTHRDPLGAVLADYDYYRDLADQLLEESHHGQTSTYAA